MIRYKLVNCKVYQSAKDGVQRYRKADSSYKRSCCIAYPVMMKGLINILNSVKLNLRQESSKEHLKVNSLETKCLKSTSSRFDR